MMLVIFLAVVSVKTSTGTPSEKDIAEKCHKLQLKIHCKKVHGYTKDQSIRQLSNSNKAMILQTSECAIIRALTSYCMASIWKNESYIMH